MIGCRGTVLYDYKTEPLLVKGLLTLSLSKKMYECKYKEKKTEVCKHWALGVRVHAYEDLLYQARGKKRCDNWEQRKVRAAWKMEAEQRAKKRTERSGDAGSANISEEGFSLRSGCGVQPLGIDLF